MNNRIEVYNVLGQQVYQSTINSDNTEVNMRNQPNGVYLYRVITLTGELVGEGKIVKQ
jgi:Secretion system C-terminal sorting domain